MGRTRGTAEIRLTIIGPVAFKRRDTFGTERPISVSSAFVPPFQEKRDGPVTTAAGRDEVFAGVAKSDKPLRDGVACFIHSPGTSCQAISQSSRLQRV
jgi:hypothetical protein